MHVPEAAVDEDRHPTPRKHDVWNAGQVPPMEPEPKPGLEEGLPDEPFRLRVPAPDAGHHPAAHRGVNDVGQAALRRASGTSNSGAENGRENMASLHSGRFAHSEIIFPFDV